MVEQLTLNQLVSGSSPDRGTTSKPRNSEGIAGFSFPSMTSASVTLGGSAMGTGGRGQNVPNVTIKFQKCVFFAVLVAIMPILANLIACLIVREDQSARLLKGTGLSFHCSKWKFTSSPHLCATQKVSLNPSGKTGATLDSTILLNPGNHGIKSQRDQRDGR